MHIKNYDWTPLSHAALAVAAQIILWAALTPLTPAAMAIGTTFGIAYFLGREVAQAEKRWQNSWGQWHWWRGWHLTRWDKGSLLDLAYPIAACLIAYIIWHITRP